MDQTEYDAGPGRKIVRHSAAFMAREGSGYESKISVAALYGETAPA